MLYFCITFLRGESVMASVSIRQSGGANIVSIPKAIVNTLGLQVGSQLDLSIKNGQIILTPVEEEMTLESLLDGSPKECFKVTDEDKEWLEMPTVGKEVL
jgi:AbrB family looped-hinge helix DNA binding protein